MNSRFVIYSKSALHTFFFLAATYLLLSLCYLFGILPVPSDEVRAAYFFGIWLFLPASLLLVVLVLPFIVLGEFLVTRFKLSRRLPVISIFPIGLILPFIGVTVAPVILIPIILLVIFVYPLSGDDSNWGLVESAVFSFNFSFAFIIFWHFSGKYTCRLNKSFDKAVRAKTPASSSRH